MELDGLKDFDICLVLSDWLMRAQKLSFKQSAVLSSDFAGIYKVARILGHRVSMDPKRSDAVSYKMVVWYG